jgi:hypothetical protein
VSREAEPGTEATSQEVSMRPRNHKRGVDLGMAVRGWTLGLIALAGLLAVAQAGAETSARRDAAIAATHARLEAQPVVAEVAVAAAANPRAAEPVTP